MKKACLALLIAAPLLLVSPELRAQESSSQLFSEGVQLFQRGQVDAACKKFEQSYALDGATGTLFNLASCHEKQGKLWKARQEYEQLADEMKAAAKADKAALAEKRAAAVEARLPKLVLHFAAGSNVASIEIDGRPLAKDKWKQPIPVDSGHHAVLLEASGMQSRTLHVDAKGEGVVTTVPVPVLTAAPSATASPTHAATVVLTTALPADKGTEQPAWWTIQRKLGAALGGVAVVGIGIGTVFGLDAISKKNKADDLCGQSGDVCPDTTHANAAESMTRKARTAATISTISFGCGIAALAVGGYLLFSGGASPPADQALWISPSGGPRSAGVQVDGRF